MKKIMFNDKYGLTRAVLEGRKTQTMRIAYDFRKHAGHMVFRSVLLPSGSITYMDGKVQVLDELPKPRYKVGEVVAVAQSYKDLLGEEYLPTSIENEIIALVEANSKGISNKMFVRADLMPHRIKITNIRIERLQDISEEDCLKEGFEKILVNKGCGNMSSHWEYLLTYDDKLGRSLQLGSRYHKEAFEILIDKTCGVGTWESNPYVFVYDFELIR